MKYRRSDVRRQAHTIPDLKFENQSLTSFAGIVVFSTASLGLEPENSAAGLFSPCAG